MNNELKTNCISDIAGYAIRATRLGEASRSRTHPARRAVAEMGVEPIRPLWTGDFKSPASAFPPLGLTA
jgi:hypothetical protein